MRIAIIGSGIAGLTVAHRLHRDHDITLFEANDYVGGHTATVDVHREGRTWAIDTGFIVFNDWTYPNFIALLDEVGAQWQWSDMSFSYQCERTGLEYNGTSINTLFAQRLNCVRPSFLRMIAEILRFNSRARELLNSRDNSLSLGEYLRKGNYSREFSDRYILPMGKAIWSATEQGMFDFPAIFFVDFFDKHGFLNVNNRPVWRTVCGGSREYVRKLTAPFLDRILLSTPVAGVVREPNGVTVRTRGGDTSRFDYVVFACHSDQAARLLQEPASLERDILGAFPYQENDVVLHTDERLLPRTPLARAAWNYFAPVTAQERVAVTYDMNVLQALSAKEKFLVTLNQNHRIDPSRVLGRYVYSHPVYTPAAVAAQARRAEISGRNRTVYCGAYWRNGFHEDGVVTGQWAVTDLQRMINAERNGTTASPFTRRATV
ncbi:MAG: FAD-dependent oxidoreductase [Steroidobacteraceae bacterium]